MIKLTVQIMENDYLRLELAARHAGKSLEAFINDLITQFPNKEQSFDVTQDPIYQIDGYESGAPEDLSVNLDKYLYGEDGAQTRKSQ